MRWVLHCRMIKAWVKVIRKRENGLHRQLWPESLAVDMEMKGIGEWEQEYIVGQNLCWRVGGLRYEGEGEVSMAIT